MMCRMLYSSSSVVVGDLSLERGPVVTKQAPQLPERKNLREVEQHGNRPLQNKQSINGQSATNYLQD